VVLERRIDRARDCLRQGHSLLRNKINAKRKETKVGKLTAFNTKRDANDRDKKDQAGQNGLQSKNPPDGNRPNNVEKAVTATEATTSPIIADVIVREDETLAEGKEEEPRNLDSLQSTRNQKASATEHYPREEPSQEQVPSSEKKPDDV
jgi:hypothetical protein